MVPLSTVTLLTNGLTLSLALGFLLIVLWHDVKSELNQFFAIFLFLVTLWNVGSLLLQATILIDPGLPVADFAVNIMEIGFIGSSVAIYVLTTILVGAHTRRFRLIAFSSLLLIIFYQVFLAISRRGTPTATVTPPAYQFQGLSVFYYLIFNSITFYLVWRYRRKLRSGDLMVGIVVFVVGQSIGFLNPELSTLSLSTNLGAFGTLVLSFGILRQEIITPLTNRISQVEAIHNVSLAITSQIALDTVLNEIATQAAGWLNADAAGIFLTNQDGLNLATVHNLPEEFLQTHLALGDGVSGNVAATHQSIYLENYGRDWVREPDLPLAKETFGSVICVPLIYGGDAIGVLMVIAGLQGRLFNQDDVHLLELLSAQAAVAIAHSRLFAEQRQLTQQVEAARSQLETVLTSTENPVIAVDRFFRMIFANPAARRLFSISDQNDNKLITEVLPVAALPELNRDVLRDLRRKNGHIYEISFHNRVYLCHLAALGTPRRAGWVAVLNDITQLKELDHLKSEMVRWASHDLKNPLTGAMLYLDLLSEDLADLEDDDIHESIKIIEKQLERMNRIIRGILDLEQLKVGKLVAEPCYPKLVIQHTLDEVQHTAHDKNITLDTEIDETCSRFFGDQDQFERALINLVENAIKFTSSGGHVSVSVVNDEGKVLFTVKDNGIGIPESIQPQIFDRFFRGASRGQQGAEQSSGSGLGLSLVKTIVENHNGKVWVESEEGKGSTFFVAVPADAD